MPAKPYLKSGPDCTWRDGGAHAVGSATAGTVVSYNLTGITDRDEVCEIGVQFVYDAESSGGSLGPRRRRCRAVTASF
jgi:hypothetical protein